MTGAATVVGVAAAVVAGVTLELAVSMRLVLPESDEEPPAVSAATPTAKAAIMPSAPAPCMIRRRRPIWWARAATAARSRSPGTGRRRVAQLGAVPARSPALPEIAWRRRRASRCGGRRGRGWRAASPTRPSTRAPSPRRPRAGRRGSAARSPRARRREQAVEGAVEVDALAGRDRARSRCGVRCRRRCRPAAGRARRRWRGSRRPARPRPRRSPGPCASARTRAARVSWATSSASLRRPSSWYADPVGAEVEVLEGLLEHEVDGGGVDGRGDRIVHRLVHRLIHRLDPACRIARPWVDEPRVSLSREEYARG